jgi:NAD(P)-dependent dehydrogenase (short-subunit alcohol dehydrogenase family)
MGSIFKGKVALVTGASQGIGLAVATNLARQGMRVWVVARRGQVLRDAAAALEGEWVCVEGDLTEPSFRRELASVIEEREQGLDLLVNNAGIFRQARVDSSSDKDFTDLWTSNVVAPYALTRECLPLLRVRQGDIVFVNSSAGREARPGVSQYAATKHALRGFAESLRGEINQDGIRVTVLYLGQTATPLQEAIYAQEGRQYDPDRLIQPSDVAQLVASVISMPRTAEITDIAVRSMRKP